jgi:hypothetical protein
MFFVVVNGGDESVFTFRKSCGEFIPDFQRFLRCDFPRLKRLPDMISEYIFPAVFTSGQVLVFFFRKQKFLISRRRTASVTFDERSALGFVRIFGVIRAFFEGLGNGFPLVNFERLYPCCGYEITPLQIS